MAVPWVVSGVLLLDLDPRNLLRRVAEVLFLSIPKKQTPRRVGNPTLGVLEGRTSGPSKSRPVLDLPAIQDIRGT